MSLKIYLDDCAYAKDLVRLLRLAGHEVVTPAEAGMTSADDEVHFGYAAAQSLVILTKNPDDFAELHAMDSGHAGILAVYQDNNPDRDMSYADIVRAIGNLERAGVEIAGNFHNLNVWRY